MGADKVFIPLCLTIEEYDVLLKAINYFSHSSVVFDYDENIETCRIIRNKIMQYLQPKENFIKYLKEEKTEN